MTEAAPSGGTGFPARVRWVAGHFEELVTAIVFLVMTAVGFANVVVRYLTDYSLGGVSELLPNLFVWLTFFGAAIAVKRKAHLAVTVLVERLPTALQVVTAVLVYLLGAIFFAAVIYQGYVLTAQDVASGVRTYALGLPRWTFSVGLPVGAAFILLRLTEAAIRDIPRIWHHGGLLAVGRHDV